MADKKQEEITLIYSYPLKKMGHVPMPKKLPHWVMLHESFIRKAGLPTSHYCAGMNVLSRVNCPFCKTGVLRLVKAEPVYSGGPNPRPSTLHHVANNLEYDCSNEQCDAKFDGKYQWMYID